MPVYVYRNLTTGATFEVEQRMTDAALTVDPTTGDPVKRLIQPVGIAFKGSGFYVNDSRKTSSSAASTGSGKSGEASEAVKSGEPSTSGEPSKAGAPGKAGDAPPPAKPAAGASAAAGD